MKTEWFKDWFNSADYLKVYRHRNQTEAEALVNLILNNIRLDNNAKVLDMACGSGRHSILLAKKGLDVTAVDLSKNLLSVAKQLAEKDKLNINFINSDLRNFRTSVQFDLIVNLFTSFGYFDDDLENFGLLKTAFDHLKKNGYFILDYFNTSFIQKNLVPESYDNLDSATIIQKRKIEGLRLNKEIIIKNNSQSDNYFESVRMYTQDELITQLNKIGFDIKKTFGDFQGNEFNENLSTRIIIIAQK